jgi:hypothetical protein
MSATPKNTSHANLVPDATATRPSNPTRIVVVPFERYEVSLRLTEDDRVVEVVEVKVRKDFLTPEQRIAATAYQDVDEFYRE